MPETVIVGCNFPNGLVLRLFDKKEVFQEVMNGVKRVVEISVPRANAQVTLRGPAVVHGELPRYKIIGKRPREGYGLTRVDAAFFHEWWAQNQETDLVKNKVVIVHKDTAGMAKDMLDVRSGMEPLNPGIVRGPDGNEKHADARISNRISTRPKDEDAGFIE